MRGPFRVVLFVLILSMCVPLPSMLQAQGAGVGISSATLTYQIDRMKAGIVSLKNAKRKLGTVIRSKVSKSKKNKAKNLNSDADLYIKDAQDEIKTLRLFLPKIFEDEFDGVIKTKNQEKFSKHYGRSEKFLTTINNQVGRMNSFFADSQPKPPANFSGHWNTNFGPIEFNLYADNKYSAIYAWSGGGAVVGTVDGQVMRGSYKDSNGKGTFKLIMFDSGAKWSGTYKSSTSDGAGAWNGSR